MWPNPRLCVRCAFALLIITGAATPIAISAADWNPIGGNSARNSVALQRGPTNADVLWETDATSATNAVWADMPFVWGDYVFTSRVASVFDISNSSVIEAFDLHTGERLWTLQLPVNAAHPGWSNRVLGV
ncbi:MAG: hypothetical protein KDA33_12735, partial [Phycisphaerales bacterium]|nr:hypothetical protein [Phycisphaerales bacterium]